MILQDCTGSHGVAGTRNGYCTAGDHQVQTSLTGFSCSIVLRMVACKKHFLSVLLLHCPCNGVLTTVGGIVCAWKEPPRRSPADPRQVRKSHDEFMDLRPEGSGFTILRSGFSFFVGFKVKFGVRSY